jgi:hypothetical protein
MGGPSCVCFAARPIRVKRSIRDRNLAGKLAKSTAHDEPLSPYNSMFSDYAANDVHADLRHVLHRRRQSCVSRVISTRD